jgi:hypothetical protein
MYMYMYSIEHNNVFIETVATNNVYYISGH